MSSKSQIVGNDESLSGEKNSGMKWVICEACVGDNRDCKCEEKIGDLKYVEPNIPTTHQPNSSFFHAVINMTGMLIGLGQLSTPYALENGGWVSIFLLIGLGAICTYTSHILGKCLDKNPKSRSYSDIGQQAFGTKGRILATTFIYMEIFMALVSYTISLHDNLKTVFSGNKFIFMLSWGNVSASQWLTMVAVLVAVPSLWIRNLSSISFLSSGGILMSVVIFLSVAFVAAFGGVEGNYEIPVLELRKIPAISGLYIFSYAGHIVFPDLYKSMKEPAKFTKVSIVSFASVTALYTSLAFMGARLFGPQVNSQITLSMPPHLIVTKIALWATVLTPMTKYALEFAPFAIQLERSLPHSLTPKLKLVIRGIVGSILLLVILALALSLPYFEHFLGLTGSLVSVTICIVLPCAFYIKICWPSIGKPFLVLNLIFIAFGSFLGVVGTISTSRLLIKTILRAHSK
ncbi:amino acid transporter AVT1H [Mercurialis annua]|uniref:amino acid transporter AVT1H n=1 Tax=Mercurialis annua TaxID=3986 RepID=UPI00215E856B|nr:amino acid transporter AVT1H [Mercurialis annua]